MSYCENECAGCTDYVVVEPRRFFTKEEKVQMLKEYKEALDKEAQGVSERIAELEKE